MWDRCKLKEMGKQNFKKSYLAAFVVSLIFMLVSGGIGGGRSNSTNGHNNLYETNTILDKAEPMVSAMSGSFESLSMGKAIMHSIDGVFKNSFFLAVVSISVIITISVVLFLRLPMEVGKNRFFMENINEKPQISTILYSYKEGRLKNTVWTMAFRDVFILLWTFLLIIPGIVKGFEYFAVPYILAENPNLPRQRVFDLSKEMTKGHKMDLFILNLSFIGWFILNAVTFNLSALFYVNPYLNATLAQAYEFLRQKALYNNFADISELPGFLEQNNNLFFS